MSGNARYWDRPAELQHYRWTVRCDRDFAHRIARAAKAAGVSETAFVQAHFETILDPHGREKPGVNFDEVAFGRTHLISPAAARVWNRLCQSVNAEGFVRVAAASLVELVGRDEDFVRNLLRELRAAKLITQVGAQSRNGVQYMVTRPAGGIGMRVSG